MKIIYLAISIIIICAQEPIAQIRLFLEGKSLKIDSLPNKIDGILCIEKQSQPNMFFDGELTNALVLRDSLGIIELRNSLFLNLLARDVLINNFKLKDDLINGNMLPFHVCLVDTANLTNWSIADDNYIQIMNEKALKKEIDVRLKSLRKYAENISMNVTSSQYFQELFYMVFFSILSGSKDDDELNLFRHSYNKDKMGPEFGEFINALTNVLVEIGLIDQGDGYSMRKRC